MEAQIFKALGDPVRLEIVRRLAMGTTYTMGELTGDLDISRQGARKQVQVLASANVVRLVPKGRVVQVTLDMNALRRSKEFIAQIEHQWDTRLSKLKEVVEKGKK
jgi:DNA-binding transcriptional ArsR family regulator